MDIVLGNLLIIITLFGSIAYTLIWMKISVMGFEQVFSFSRKECYKKQLIQNGKLLVAVALLCYVLYGLILYMIQIIKQTDVIGVTKVSFLGMMFPALVLLCDLFCFSVGKAGMTDKVRVIYLCSIMLSPCLLIIGMQYIHIELDQYAGYLSLVMIVLNVWMFCLNRIAWRRGDY